MFVKVNWNHRFLQMHLHALYIRMYVSELSSAKVTVAMQSSCGYRGAGCSLFCWFAIYWTVRVLLFTWSKVAQGGDPERQVAAADSLVTKRWRLCSYGKGVLLTFLKNRLLIVKKYIVYKWKNVFQNNWCCTCVCVYFLWALSWYTYAPVVSGQGSEKVLPGSAQLSDEALWL